MNDILELKEKNASGIRTHLIINSNIYTIKSRTHDIVRSLYPKAERAEMCVLF